MSEASRGERAFRTSGVITSRSRPIKGWILNLAIRYSGKVERPLNSAFRWREIAPEERLTVAQRFSAATKRQTSEKGRLLHIRVPILDSRHGTETPYFWRPRSQCSLELARDCAVVNFGRRWKELDEVQLTRHGVRQTAAKARVRGWQAPDLRHEELGV